MAWTRQWSWSSPQPYDPVTSTPAEDSDEKVYDSEILSLRRKIWRLKCYLGILILLLLLSCVTLVLPSRIQDARITAASRSGPSPVPKQEITFQRDELFAGPSNSTTDAAWVALMPPGDGFVALDTTRYPSLPPGIPIKNDDTHEQYDVSMFHQLHCLNRIRSQHWMLKFAVQNGNAEDVLQVLLDPQEAHVGHCFDYIRQAIMCAGDMTLEWPREEADGRRFAVDGWGVAHQCANMDAMMNFMDENALAKLYTNIT